MYVCRLLCTSSTRVMDLSKVVKALNDIAPIRYAAKWDNVGLLVEPSSPHIVKRMLLTNDLTEDVLQEGIDQDVDMIVSYHPPIFKPLKRLTEKHWKERIIVKAIENKIAIYSPHTASDSVQEGVNDWLASGLGDLSSSRPITADSSLNSGGLLLCKKDDEHLLTGLGNVAPNNAKLCTETGTLLQINRKQISQAAGIISNYDISDKVHFFAEARLSNAGIAGGPGTGRLCILQHPASLSKIINNVKSHLNLDYLRLGLGIKSSLNTQISTIALCAGSGASVLSGVEADLYLTGEMSHHEVLEATQNGTNVLLCEHSNSERGYLQVLKSKIYDIFGKEGLSITISCCDKDPIEIV